MSERIMALEQMLAADPSNTFARYGLAMERVKAAQFIEALAEFDTLLEQNPGYAAAYFHGGQTAEKLGDLDRARAYYETGLANTRDPHARGEMQAALDLLP